MKTQGLGYSEALSLLSSGSEFSSRDWSCQKVTSRSRPCSWYVWQPARTVTSSDIRCWREHLATYPIRTSKPSLCIRCKDNLACYCLITKWWNEAELGLTLQPSVTLNLNKVWQRCGVIVQIMMKFERRFLSKLPVSGDSHWTSQVSRFKLPVRFHISFLVAGVLMWMDTKLAKISGKIYPRTHKYF